MTAVGMVLQSGASGERVVFNATGLHTYDATNVERLTIGTAPVKGVKAITGRGVFFTYHYRISTVVFWNVRKIGLLRFIYRLMLLKILDENVFLSIYFITND